MPSKTTIEIQSSLKNSLKPLKISRVTTFWIIPSKGLGLEVGLKRWELFKKTNPKNPNSTLYRTFKINPLKFWEWWQYIAHTERYSLPHRSSAKTENS